MSPERGQHGWANSAANGEVPLPYPSTRDLPVRVRAHLPPHAQEIYLSAFNNAWNEYGDEASAHRVAWAAVKRKYRKVGKRWEESEAGGAGA